MPCSHAARFDCSAWTISWACCHAPASRSSIAFVRASPAPAVFPEGMTIAHILPDDRNRVKPTTGAHARAWARRHLFVLWVVVTLTMTSSAAWAASEVWLPNGSAPDPLTSAPQHRRPVLFVHGHNPDDASDADFNYRKNWVQAVDGLPSFQQTLDDPANTATLDIEAYFIRFVDQHRSIVEDARDTGDAIERILARHDPSYTPFMANPSTAVRVAIVAFSKGTISARLYLKSLAVPQFDLPAPRGGFNPVSEFVAL